MPNYSSYDLLQSLLLPKQRETAQLHPIGNCHKIDYKALSSI